MFNSPRPGQRYIGASTTGLGGSFVDENPLTSSVYDDGLDPWSAAPSPTATPIPHGNASIFSSVIADATVPAIYNASFSAVDPTQTGETSVNSLSRVLSTSGLPAATIDKIVNLVSSRPRVSKLEFFVALALVALAQAGKDVSIEQVAALSSQNSLPEPALDLHKLQSFTPSTFRQNTSAIRANSVAYSSEDPWNTSSRAAVPTNNIFEPPRSGVSNGVTLNLAGSGLPKEWWKRQESVRVSIFGPQGFILNRYMVYEIATDRGEPVHRRYSEFVFLWDCLTRRYPFRVFPALPPKRVGPDEHFLEQRRRGLARALNFVINHPIIKDDGLLAVFLTEPSFETWRRHTSISLEEESVSKRVDRIEEMTIPSDLEEKIMAMRTRLNPLIEQWQRICILAERIIKRREAAAVRMPLAFRRTYLPTHFKLPVFPSFEFPPQSFPSSRSILSESTMESSSPPNDAGEQGDLSRLTNTLRAVVEVNEHCWRGDECELSSGVRLGLEQVAVHTQRQSELSEVRTRTLLDTTLETLKSQRDLYIATRDLFIRHDRLSIDQVERLKKRVETNSVKLDGIRAAQKDSWQEEVERYTALIEKDQAAIASQMSRRVFIRACLWHELRVVLHNYESAFLTQAVQNFAREERDFAESVMSNWASLGEAVESMPYE